MTQRWKNNVHQLLNQIEVNMKENQKEITELNRHISEVEKSKKDFNQQNVAMEAQAYKLKNALNELTN